MKSRTVPDFIRNFPEWYEAFGVTETDKMYIAPEKRISIW